MKTLQALAALALFAGASSCSRADLYPVTQDTPVDGGDLDGGGTSGTGGAGTTGNAGNAGSAGHAGSAGNAGNAATTGNVGGGGAGGGSDDGGTPANCPEVAKEPGDENRTVLVNGTTRSYVLHVPPGYDGTTQVPLVVDFHGVGGSGMSQRSSSPYPAVLDPDGVVMAFPDGLRGPAGTAWNVGPCCVADVDDVAFARALVADVEASLCIDSSRIYAVGVLTGGGMAHYLGCQAADLFAAVAPAAFDLLAENVDDCQPARPVSVISFRGTESTRVPYEGGPSALVPGMPLTFLGAEGSFRGLVHHRWVRGSCRGPGRKWLLRLLGLQRRRRSHSVHAARRRRRTRRPQHRLASAQTPPPLSIAYGRFADFTSQALSLQ